MAMRLSRISKRKRAMHSTQRRTKDSRAAVQAGTTDEPAEFLDEPATPPRKPIVPVEELVAPPQPAEDEAACGLPDEARTRGTDLH